MTLTLAVIITIILLLIGAGCLSRREVGLPGS